MEAAGGRWRPPAQEAEEPQGKSTFLQSRQELSPSRVAPLVTHIPSTQIHELFMANKWQRTGN